MSIEKKVMMWLERAENLSSEAKAKEADLFLQFDIETIPVKKALKFNRWKMFIRNTLVEESNMQPYYKEFLLQNTDEPLPKTPEWKSNAPYIIWIGDTHRTFRKLNNLSDIPYDKNTVEKFKKWMMNNRLSGESKILKDLS